MKTTLMLEPDVVNALKEQAQVLNQSFERVVNDTLRRGLSPDGVKESRELYRVKPNHSGFAPGVDPMRLKEYLYALEDEEFLQKMAE